jgi:hypothetical protein
LGDGTNANKNQPVEIFCPTSSTDDNFLSDRWSLFPNPANDFISLNWSVDDTEFGLTYEISNGFGQVVILNQSLPNSGEIHIQQLPQGFYFLTLKSENQRLTKQFLKM